jgi:hypothetical protein
LGGVFVAALLLLRFLRAANRRTVAERAVTERAVETAPEKDTKSTSVDWM